MVTRQHVQGDYYVQSTEISSSSDYYSQSLLHMHYPEGRMSYRTRAHILTNNPHNEQFYGRRLSPERSLFARCKFALSLIGCKSLLHASN